MTLNDFMADFEAERLAQAEAEDAHYNAPEAVAKREAKRREEHERGVRLGWHDEDGNSLLPEEDEDDDAEEDSDQ